MNEETTKFTPSVKRNEIDVLDLIKKLWVGRKILYKAVGVGAVLGLIVAFATPKEYKVVTTLLPQSGSESSMSSLSSLASLAGFDLNLDAGSDVTPVLYPQIVESEPFMLDVMNAKYTFSDVNQPVSMYDYYTKYDEPGILGTIAKFPNFVRSIFKKKEPAYRTDSKSKQKITYLNEDQSDLMKSLKKHILLTLNKKEGYLTLTCTFDEALLTAQVAANAQEILQKTITGYKTQKSSEQLAFIEQRYAEKKKDYIDIQNKLAGYRDRNLNVFTASANSGQERLQNEYSIAYSVYSELAKQLEQAKIQVKNQTPVFAVIKPVVVPLLPYAPKKSIILLVYILLGFVVGSGLILGKEYVKMLQKKQAEPSEPALP